MLDVRNFQINTVSKQMGGKRRLGCGITTTKKRRENEEGIKSENQMKGEDEDEEG